MVTSHPGTRPADVSFDDRLAGEASVAARALADELETAIRVHERAVDAVLVGFAGEPRDEFEAIVQTSLDALRRHVHALRGQATSIDRQRWRASELSEQRRAAQRRYDEQLIAWRRAQRGSPVGALR